MSDLAPRRTRLAGERTQLAWWRTGLAAIAVGVGIGRGLPVLDPTLIAWPYEVVGVGYVIYGIVLMQFGYRRGNEVHTAVSDSEPGTINQAANRWISIGGICLGVATALIMIFAR